MSRRPLIIGVFLLVVIVPAREVYLFSQSSPNDAQIRATRAFREECQNIVVNCEEFTGPHFDGEWRGSYKFSWKNKSGRGMFLVEISYLPFRSERWYVPDGE